MNRSELERIAGQLVVCSPEGHTTDATLTRLIEKEQVGGVILFKRSCPDPDRVRSLVTAMQRRARTPLLVMIDQEGGRVRRLTDSPYSLPSAREMTQWSPDRFQEEVGLLAARLRELGITCNLAPVLDVDTNPANPIIGDRAFGSDPETVWRFGKLYLDALLERKVIGCVKHFPGHGDTDADSHLELPVVAHDVERLRRVELEPFVRAVRDKAPMMMVAHVLYPALDPREPASLSKPIITGILREKLGYEGVIVADDLEMKAIAERYPVEELVFRLVDAGNDLLLICRSYRLADEVHRALVRLVERGDLDVERLKASHTRIMALKRRFGILEE